MQAVAAGEKPLVIRNSRIGVALMLGCAWVGFATAVLLAAIAVIELFSLFPFSVGKLYGVAAMTVSAFLSFGAGAQLRDWARSMKQNEAHLDADGVRFVLGGGYSSFGWNDIASIARQRTANNLRVYTVTTNDGRAAVFSPLSFFRAGHIAREIAARAGLALHDLR